jgi:hypothetical protein
MTKDWFNLEQETYSFVVSGQSALFGKQRETWWGIGNRNSHGRVAINDRNGADRKRTGTHTREKKVFGLADL